MIRISRKNQGALRFSDLGKHLNIDHGTFAPDKLTVFSTFRDEMFFCEAFFDHYRSLGVEQFLIIDDHSVDGTSEFLRQQGDCVVLISEFHYGDPVTIINRRDKIRQTRAGIYFKMAVPNHFFEDNFVLYVDADEFLFLPPAFEKLPELIQLLRENGINNVAASMVEFFPAKFSDLDSTFQPKSFADLIEAYPYFDSEQLLEYNQEEGYLESYPSKTTKLFAHYDVRFAPTPPPFFKRIKRRLQGRVHSPYRKTPRLKTPLIFASEDSYLKGTHRANKPGSDKILLTIAHFVFTAQLRDKIGRAQAWRSYVNSSEKYDLIHQLVERMTTDNAGFFNAQTRRFESETQFIESGLMIDKLSRNQYDNKKV